MNNNVKHNLPHVCSYIKRINSKGLWFGDDPLGYAAPSLFLQFSLISIITRVVRFILKPCRQPLIVSQILGGVILGPSILGQSSTFMSRVFPSKARVVLDTVSVFGFMLFIFLIGVKVDPFMVLRSGRKSLAVGILGFFVPYGLASLVAFLLKRFLSLDHEIQRVLSHLVMMLSMTAFPVVACFLDELKILNSEIGQLASSSSIICDVCHWTTLSIHFAAQLARESPLRATVGSFLSKVLYIIVILFAARPAALWIVRHTPEGKSVKEIYIFSILVALMGCGLTGEFIGVGALLGSLALGLVIPDGPPLGAALVEKLDSFVSTLLMPLFFTICGLQMDVFAIKKLENVGVVQLVILVAFIGKITGTILPLLFFRMPLRDAISLALIMNSKGIAELAFLNDYMMKSVMTEECYSILIISVVVITGVISPLVKVLYDPWRSFIAYKRRTILHSRSDDDLRILVCIHCQENVRAIINLLQVSNPTRQSPISLVVLHLAKLMGRASSLLVAHRKREKPSYSNPDQSERIFNVFRKFERHNNGHVIVNCYKGISPYATMHNDVCSLALEKRTVLIILPFHKQWTSKEMVETSYPYRHINKNALEKAPCSVGILIDRPHPKKSLYVITTELSSYSVAVLFIGGPDDREALAYARRMSEHRDVKLTLIRFVTTSSAAIVGGTERSKMLDGEILSDFKHKMLHSEKLSYQEEVVRNGIDVVAISRSMGNAYDLVMVGRRHGDSPIMFHLTKWNECGELGALGEILTDADFRSETSILVVQQQTKLWGLRDPEDSTHLRRVDL